MNKDYQERKENNYEEFYLEPVNGTTKSSQIKFVQESYCDDLKEVGEEEEATYYEIATLRRNNLKEQKKGKKTQITYIFLVLFF
jgi:hypothetical protein